jgi:alkyldihydroxyacetonephosphate synthase
MFFPDWHAAMDTVRRAIQGKIPLSMLRLSSAAETQTQLALAGDKRLVAWLEKLLAWRGAGVEKCMLMFGISGTKTQYRTALKQALRVFRGGTGFHIGKYLGYKWLKSRFRAPYLRNSLWEKGYAVDTLETATDWQNVDHMVNAIEAALGGVLSRERERIHIFTHLSHLYPQGASIYTTTLFRVGKTHWETFALWERLKSAASQAIIENHGTISHQHGIGLDHASYLVAEKGELGITAIKTLCRQFDPDGMMNPGKLVR